MGRLRIFHGNLPLKLTLLHFWGNNSSGLEKELKSEKEQRQALQKELQREKDTSCLLQTELQQVEGLKKVRWLNLGSALCLLEKPLQRPVSPLPPWGNHGLGTVPTPTGSLFQEEMAKASGKPESKNGRQREKQRLGEGCPVNESAQVPLQLVLGPAYYVESWRQVPSEETARNQSTFRAKARSRDL